MAKVRKGKLRERNVRLSEVGKGKEERGKDFGKADEGKD